MSIGGIKFSKGDIDGFLGIFVDNLAVFLVIISLNLYVVGMPPEIVFGRILPGAAMGLLLGNIYYAYMAKRMGAKEGRDDVTALPSGVSIVFALVYTLGILLPVTIMTGNPEVAWMVGVAATIIGAIICFFGALIGPWLRDFLPRSAMLGALAGIAIMFIAGMNLGEVFSEPYVGFLALAIIVWAYLARGKMPLRLPGGLVALILGSIIAILMGKTAVDFSGVSFYSPYPWIFHLGIETFKQSIGFLSIIIPIAVINFIATLNNVESAHCAGDKYPVREAMLVDAGATVVGAVFGCCYPNNVFIGHPGYKRLGARMGYSLLSGIVLTLLAVFGLFSFISKAVPLAAVIPILIFIGLVMTSVAFSEVKKEHYAASAIAVIPFVGEFGYEQVNMALNALKVELTPEVISSLHMAGINYTGYSALSYGTILIAMFLASIVTFAISRELKKAAGVSFVAAICAFVGLIHTPAMKWGAAPELALAWFGLGVLAMLADFFAASIKEDEENSANC